MRRECFMVSGGIMSPLTFWRGGSVWRVWLQTSQIVAFTQIYNNTWRNKLWGDKISLKNKNKESSPFFLMNLLFQSQCVNKRLLDLNHPRLLHSLVFLSEISLRLKAPPMSMLARSHHHDRKKLGRTQHFLSPNHRKHP